MPSNAPTGGWNVLAGSTGIPVTLPATVEQYYWAQLPGMDDVNGYYKGVSWWWRSFSAPTLQAGQRLIIHFRAARMRAEVYCNQKLCGYNLITEIPFDADITDAIQPGANNVLAVRITNPGGSPDWRDIELNGAALSWGTNAMPLSHSFGGLDAGIVLQVRDAVNVNDFAVLNRPNPQEVWVIGSATNSSAVAYNGPMALNIMDSNSVVLWQTTNTISMPAGGQIVFTNDVLLPGATLWNLTNPVLYQASASIPGNANSGQSVNFGFRWFTPESIGTNAFLRLNGRRIVLHSAISWGFWEPNGLFPDDTNALKEVVAAQTLGLNCLHFHRNIGHLNVFDVQDRMGLLRYEEPGAGFNAWSDSWSDTPGITTPTAASLAGTNTPENFRRKYETAKILAMVKRDRSHPSLIVYGLQNETVNSLTNGHIFYLLNEIRKIDPSRTVVLHSGIPGTPPYTGSVATRNQVLMLPYSTNLLYEDGTGYSGWADIHTWGGPGTYQDNLYLATNNFSHFSTNKTEIVTWGEMLGMGVPDDHEKIVKAYATNNATGYDLSLHQQVLAAYDQFLDRWNFRSSFPTASSLFQEIGKKSYFTWGRVIEAARACDQNDNLVISGWESTPRENHSGIVDTARNFRGDPTLLRGAMSPEVLVIRPKRFVLKPGDQANVDVLLVNETGRSGAQTLTLTARNPDGSTLFTQQSAVTVSGGDVFGQPLAANFTFMPNTNGTVLLTGVLQPNGGTGSPLTNTVELLVIDPLAGGSLLPRIAVIETGSQVKSALTNVFGITPLGPANLGDPLDAIVVGASSPVAWSYTAYNVANAIANTTDDGLYQKQFYGPAGTVGTWFGFAPGNVMVELRFAETYFNAANSRLFNVALNGNTVLTNLDIYSQAGGRYIALVKTFTVNATNGSVSLSFPYLAKDNATIAGIKITDASNNVMVVAFATTSFTDGNGLVWQPLVNTQWQMISNRVSNDGVRLVLWPNTMTETMSLVNQMAPQNLLSIGTYAGNTGYLPDNTASWMGSWYFARQHWLMNGLPANTVLGWQYQIPHGTGDGGGLLIAAAPGKPMDVMIGYGRDHEGVVAVGACVIQSGNGQIVLPALPRLRDALGSAPGNILTQPTALRMLGNALRAAPAAGPLAPPSLIGVPLNGQAVLDWSDAFGATSYNLKRASASGGPYTVIASNLVSTIFTNTGLANGATYYYVVSGSNNVGESLPSTEVAVTPQTSGLVAQWKFDEGSGTTATDSVGGNDGTLAAGATWATGRIINAVSLNGTGGSYVFLPAGIVSTLNDFSITAWVFLNSSSAWQRVFDFGSGSGSYMFLTANTGGGQIRFSMLNNGTGNDLNGTAPSLNAWHHLVVTLSGSTGTLYIDGVAVGTNSSVTLKPSALGSTTQNYIGKSQYDDPILNGRVDDFRIYNRALSAAEISALANPPATSPVNVSASWSGGMLNLTWPTDHTGWRLQCQTNALAAGLGTNWFDVAGATGTNGISLPINATHGSTFYRLTYP